MKELPSLQSSRKPIPLIKGKKTEKQSTLTKLTLQAHFGNRAIQRLLAQRAGDGAFDLDDATTSRINAARGGGQALDSAVQKQMGESMGADFSPVRVHTGSEAHHLNEQLSAKAFTTGQDIFFREGAYAPNSSGGQELIAHELTHVVQQGSGVVGGSGSVMRVNAPGDRFEQEAETVAKTVTTAGSAPAVQRQTPEEEVQTMRLQRQELEEEAVQSKALQRQEEVQRQELQRQTEDEEAVQRQATPAEEPEVV